MDAKSSHSYAAVPSSGSTMTSARSVLIDGRRSWVRYAAQFPHPRTERVSPSHLVAVTRTPGGTDVIIWRWYDAVVVEERVDEVTLWEAAHGEVTATRRPSYRSTTPGTRAYLSAGLPDAEWWVAGPVDVRLGVDNSRARRAIRFRERECVGQLVADDLLAQPTGGSACVVRQWPDPDC